MKYFHALMATAALTLGASTAVAQTTTTTTGDTSTTTPAPTQSRQQDRLNAIFGALFGGRAGETDTVDAQWAAGRTPLATQRVQFDSRIDTDVRNGALARVTGDRLKNDYAALVQLEARYGADRRFTSTERADLGDRYGALTQVLADGSYGDDTSAAESPTLAQGQGDFARRVDAAVAARRISRTAGTRLKSDYAALIGVEISYLRDGTLSVGERDDLDARLDLLDTRVGDVGYNAGAVVLTPRARLDGIARALPSSGLTSMAQTQLRVEHGDLMRLEAAYARLTPTAEERAYLERRLADLEVRVRIAR